VGPVTIRIGRLTLTLSITAKTLMRVIRMEFETQAWVCHRSHPEPPHDGRLLPTELESSFDLKTELKDLNRTTPFLKSDGVESEKLKDRQR